MNLDAQSAAKLQQSRQDLMRALFIHHANGVL